MNDSARNDAHTPQLEPSEGSRPNMSPATESAGSLLRAAREKSGLHIAALAAALKVPVRKLEALEANRWEELTDATFTRALASSVARHLRADPAAVLAALPSNNPIPLVISDGLGKAAPDHSLRSSQPFKPMVWGIGLLLLASVAMYFAPRFWPEGPPVLSQEAEPVPLVPLQATEPAEPTVSNSGTSLTVAPLSTPAGLPQPTALDPSAVAVAPTAESRTASSVANNAQPLMVLKATRDTWVEATDNTGRLRIQRVVKAGEEVSFADASSLAVVIGNAAGAQVTVHGQPMDLQAVAKNNIARFEVK